MKGIKFFAVFTFFVSAASLGGNWYLYQHFNAETARQIQLESQVVQLEEQITQLKPLEKKVTQFQEEVDRLRTQMKGYVGQRDTLKKELDEAHKESGDLRKQLKDLESQKGVLVQKVSLDEVRDKAIAQEAIKLPSAAKAASALVPLTVTVATQSNTKQTKQAPGKAGKKPEAPAAQADVDPRPSQVLSVNRQFNFVVVNVGIRDHIKIGDVLRVEQNGKLMGRVKVGKLYENFSACTILEETLTNKIKEGDLVRVA